MTKKLNYKASVFGLVASIIVTVVFTYAGASEFFVGYFSCMAYFMAYESIEEE